MTTNLDRPALPTIALYRCTGCGLCAELCPTDAVEIHANKAIIVRPEDCTFCEICESYCPEGAIERPFTIVFAAAAAGGGPARVSRAEAASSAGAPTASPSTMRSER